jgi:hypothetical protein
MNRKLLLNLGLLALVAGLGAYVYWKPDEQPAPVEHRLSTLKPTAVKRIEVERRGGEPVVLVLEGAQWYIAEPFRARADNVEVRQLAQIVTAASDQKFSATDLARFDLAEPAARLRIDGQEFRFGTINPMTKQVYVQTGDAVYMVSAQYAMGIPGRAVELTEHRLWTSEEAKQIVGVDIGSFRVRQTDGRWTVEPALVIEQSQDDLARFIDEWRLASSTITVPMKLPLTKDIMRVFLKDGGTIELVVASRAPEWVLIRPDEKMQYHIGREAARRMLDPGWK